MELIDIVDEDNNFTGEILEREDVYTQNKYHRLISVFIVNNDRMVLIQRRSDSKEKNAGKYDILNGHVRSKEDEIYAAIREVKEELSVNIFKEELELLKVYKSEGNTKYFRYIFLLNRNIDIDEIVLDKEEVSEAKYISKDEFIKIANDSQKSKLYNKSYLNDLVSAI